MGILSAIGLSREDADSILHQAFSAEVENGISSNITETQVAHNQVSDIPVLFVLLVASQSAVSATAFVI